PTFTILNNGISDTIDGSTHVPSEMPVDYFNVHFRDPHTVAVTPEANYSGLGAVAVGPSALHRPSEILNRSPEIPPPPAGDSPPAENLVGDANENLLIDDARNDLLTSNRGNDTPNGFAGVDTLVGGTRNDRYVSNRAPHPATRGAGATLGKNG